MSKRNSLSKVSSSSSSSSVKGVSMKPINTLSLSLVNNKVGSSFTDQQRSLINYSPTTSMSLPTRSRKVRDSSSLLFMLAFLGFLAYVIWDGLLVKETDVNLIVHGHDSYGNICGRNNKPIRFVEKSGKNYTDKPYTKYTLINAQFERYTLATEKLKNGELFYVKQDNFFDSREEKRTINRIKRSALIQQTELMRKNQTLLNKIKSSLMYEYPPMHGYNPSVVESKPPSAAAANSSLLKQRLKQGGPINSIRKSSSNVQFQATSSTAHQLDIAESQTEYSLLSVISSTPATLTPVRPTTLTVIFDDHLNDSDPYEHVLVSPKSNHMKPRSPEIINQFEASNQLLYLTECVDYCPPTDHVELIFYRCMPKNWRFSLFPNAINVTRTFIDDIITDLSHCYKELIYIFSFALVLSLALLILLRFLASFIIWSCLILLISLFLSMAIYSWTSYYYQILDLNNLMPHDSIYSEKLAVSDKWLIGAIFLTFIAFAVIATIIFMRKRILLVTILFKESGKAIADMPLLLLQPLLTFAVLVLITIIWTMGLICLQSVKVPLIDRTTGFVVFKAETLYKVMKWYHIFAFLWISHFAIACQHYVIGASVSKWYFSTDRYNLNSPIGTSVSELILYYLGSVALGSFLVAIFKVIRIVTRQIQYLVQRNCMSPPNGTNQSTSVDQTINPASIANPTCGSLSYLWRLFIWFFDNIVMIINRDAYVEIAIHGHSFLSGAKRAFTVLASNPLRLLAIKSVSNVLLVIAKICVVFGTVSMATLLLEEKTNQLNYFWSPIVISAMYAYIVAHWFLSVYEMVIDALFICYCEDYELTKLQESNNQLTGSNFMTHILNSNNGSLN